MAGVSNGSMAAVLGLTEERVAAILAEERLDALDVANYNAPTQIVLSGPKEEIEGAAARFEAAGAMYFPLFVSGAFHSRYMADVKREFDSFLGEFTFDDPRIPVIANVDARPYARGTVKQNLVEEITHPVCWTETIRYLWGLGVTDFQEVGPGDVLTKLVVRIQAEAEPLVIPAEEQAPERERTGPACAAEADDTAASEITDAGDFPLPSPHFVSRRIGSAADPSGTTTTSRTPTMRAPWRWASPRRRWSYGWREPG